MKRHFTFLIFLCFTLLAFTADTSVRIIHGPRKPWPKSKVTRIDTTKDRRALLDIRGRVEELSVSPTGKLWFTTYMGRTYYADDIHSLWHNGKKFANGGKEDTTKDDDDSYTPDAPLMDRINFFNKDTAFITGSIESKGDSGGIRGYFYTTDAGKNWKLIDYAGDYWIYDVFIGKGGKAWMGGSDGDILYTKDYAQHWEKLKSPYNNSTRMDKIFMLNDSTGVSGALENEIYVTNNNWKTCKKIPTPFDQKLYPKSDDESEDNRINKLVILGNYIVVEQIGNIFYSDRNIIQWKKLPVNISCFTYDAISKSMFAITDSMNLVKFSTPTVYKTVRRNLPGDLYAYSMRAVDNSVYVMKGDYHVVKINEKECIETAPYTTDQKIPEPWVVKKGNHITWGLTQSELCIDETGNKDWYREASLGFAGRDFYLLNDSAIVIWDGIKDNYLYSLTTHKATLYHPTAPLGDFVKYPVKCIEIVSGSGGCFHSFADTTAYSLVNEKLVTKGAGTAGRKFGGYKSVARHAENSMDAHKLDSILNEINKAPGAVAPLKDFNVTEADKKHYKTLVDQKIKEEKEDGGVLSKKRDAQFYYAVPGRIDTIQPGFIRNVLDQQEGITSTTTNWLYIQIINTNMDTIFVRRDFYESSLAWHLPFKFSYKEKYFNCYSISFAKYMNEAIPKGFYEKEMFDNSYLILNIADYLWALKNRN